METGGRVFKALADPTRRALLDTLHERNGLTATELIDGLQMTRQSAAQHVDILEEANLIATVRRGREKLHYLNPVPIHEIQERWIDKFEHPRLETLRAIKQKAERSMTDRPTFVYVTYIESTPAKVWHALTDADLTATYWGHRNVSDWNIGSRWEHRRTDGTEIVDCFGTVIESSPPSRLVATWQDPNEVGPEVISRVTFAIEPFGDIVRLTVTHEDLADEEDLKQVGSGWPAVLSNLKSLLETGRVLSRPPWEMPVADGQTADAEISDADRRLLTDEGVEVISTGEPE